MVEVRIFLEPGVSFKKMSDGASGFDLYARMDEEQSLRPFTPYLFPSGVYISMPPGLEAVIRPRSSLSKKGILAAVGTVDSDYRGELSVGLINLTLEPYVVKPGDRIAQLVFSAVETVNCVEVEDVHGLGETIRGTGGFGSTGR